MNYNVEFTEEEIHVLRLALNTLEMGEPMITADFLEALKGDIGTALKKVHRAIQSKYNSPDGEGWRQAMAIPERKKGKKGGKK